MLATLIRQLGDFQLAEDALQEALEAALVHWTAHPPERPAAWLLTAARRKALDRLRRGGVAQRKHDELARLAALEHSLAKAPEDAEVIADDTLRLVFTCAHPALSMEARVALTLRTLGGLTTGQIARAFLVPEVAMAQRLVRAKKKIKGAGIPYRVPAPEELPERLDGVLAVLYLIFNEGYFPGEGEDAFREELCREAIRLAVLVTTLTDEPEAEGLVALMLLVHSRRNARLDASGIVAPLEKQDRSSWDSELIAEGRRILHSALARRRPGPYQIQAAISALHAEAVSGAQTDWPQIVLLYRELLSRRPSPVVELNLAVALANLRGAQVALERIDALAGLEAYQPFHAARSEMLRRLGRHREAVEAYDLAIALTDNAPVRRFLEQRRDRQPGDPAP